MTRARRCSMRWPRFCRIARDQTRTQRSRRAEHRPRRGVSSWRGSRSRRSRAEAEELLRASLDALRGARARRSRSPQTTEMLAEVVEEPERRRRCSTAPRLRQLRGPRRCAIRGARPRRVSGSRRRPVRLAGEAHPLVHLRQRRLGGRAAFSAPVLSIRSSSASSERSSR